MKMQGKQRSTMLDYSYIFELVVSLRNLEFFKLSDKIQVENKLAECQLAHFMIHFNVPAAQLLWRLDLESRAMRITKL
jgi:hypothetical protein